MHAQTVDARLFGGPGSFFLSPKEPGYEANLEPLLYKSCIRHCTGPCYFTHLNQRLQVMF